MFVMQFANVIDDFVPLIDFEENTITAMNKSEFKKMWILSKLEEQQ